MPISHTKTNFALISLSSVTTASINIDCELVLVSSFTYFVISHGERMISSHIGKAAGDTTESLVENTPCLGLLHSTVEREREREREREGGEGERERYGI